MRHKLPPRSALQRLLNWDFARLKFLSKAPDQDGNPQYGPSRSPVLRLPPSVMSRPSPIMVAGLQREEEYDRDGQDERDEQDGQK
jgi:hypothetical protein